MYPERSAKLRLFYKEFSLFYLMLLLNNIMRCEGQSSPRRQRTDGFFYNGRTSIHFNICVHASFPCCVYTEPVMVICLHTEHDPCAWQTLVLIIHDRMQGTAVNPFCQAGEWPWPMLLPEATFPFIMGPNQILKHYNASLWHLSPPSFPLLTESA